MLLHLIKIIVFICSFLSATQSIYALHENFDSDQRKQQNSEYHTKFSSMLENESDSFFSYPYHNFSSFLFYLQTTGILGNTLSLYTHLSRIFIYKDEKLFYKSRQLMSALIHLMHLTWVIGKINGVHISEIFKEKNNFISELGITSIELFEFFNAPLSIVDSIKDIYNRPISGSIIAIYDAFIVDTLNLTDTLFDLIQKSDQDSFENTDNFKKHYNQIFNHLKQSFIVVAGIYVCFKYI